MVFLLTYIAESQVSTVNPVSNETISIAVLDNFPPFSFSVRGKVVGFTIDYLDLLSREAGTTITLVPGKCEENLAKFKNGDVDAITALSHTVERDAFTWFTTPYYLIPTVVYIRENSLDYSGIKSLQDRWIGVTLKDMQETLMPADREFINAHIQKYGGVRLGFHENWYPIDFTDQDNRHAGICAQLFEMMSELHDIP